MKMKTKWVEEVDNFRLVGKSMDKVIIINHGVNYYKIDEICGRMVCCKAVEDSVLDVIYILIFNLVLKLVSLFRYAILTKKNLNF